MGLKFTEEEDYANVAVPELLDDFNAIVELSAEGKRAVIVFATDEDRKATEYQLRKAADYLTARDPQGPGFSLRTRGKAVTNEKGQIVGKYAVSDRITRKGSAE